MGMNTLMTLWFGAYWDTLTVSMCLISQID